MRNRDAFSGYHPTVCFLYFTLVLMLSMCLMHPVYLAISLTGALAYAILLKGRKAVRFAAMGLLPMAALAALVNPAFNHEGATILTYLPSGNPLTLESMLYGAAAAVMLASVVLWFSSFNEVITSDKFVYLFGRILPALSLVLSMALRFIPKFKSQLQVVSEAQTCIGRDTKTGSVFRRVGNAIRIFPLWSHGAWKTRLKRQIPCVRAATACRGAPHFRSTALTAVTVLPLHGWFSAARICSPDGLPAEQRSGTIPRSKPPRGHP